MRASGGFATGLAVRRSQALHLGGALLVGLHPLFDRPGVRYFSGFFPRCFRNRLGVDFFLSL